MIRISMGGIKIYTKTDDRWGRPITYWQVLPWGYVDLETYFKLRAFEDTAFNADLIKAGVWDLAEVIKRQMDLLGATSQVHQFNVIQNLRKDRWIRMVAVLRNEDETNRIKMVSWFDAYVKYPIYKLICVAANKVLS